MTLLLRAFEQPDLTWTLRSKELALPAQVPGTVGGALQAAGRLDLMAPPDLEAQDWTFETQIEGQGPHLLCLDGIATAYDVVLDDLIVTSCESMYARHRIDLDLSGRHRLRIQCHAMGHLYERTGKRARWRPKLVAPQSLRLLRKSFLGHAGGWCPNLRPVGPYRDVRLVPARAVIGDVTLTTRCEGDDGLLDIRIVTSARDVHLHCGHVAAIATPVEPGVLACSLRLPKVAKWWPHTHGEPTLHAVTARVDGDEIGLGRVGFRTVAIDRDSDGDGFGLRVNGVPVFCRGALWSNADLASLPGTRDAYAPLLTLARDAGMNMLRIGGTMTYETKAFFDLADELGLLVWQDVMLANFDYPAGDPAFVAQLVQEVDDVLDGIGAAPSLAVLCGASEVAQQAAMMGLPQGAWSNALFDEALSRACHDRRPDVPYVPHTPMGGALPFEPRRGICHYYGVSAYMRPLEDARQAGVRFAAECLGFAHVPDGEVSLDRIAGMIEQPLWGERYEHDVGATWFFEDVRNHYLQALYGVDPAALCRGDPSRYLDLSRAVTAELAESVFGLWRRHGSPTRGGLVWFLRDLYPGAGFGIVDSGNRPKAVWHGLSRAFRPVQVVLTDEGLNGIDVHVLNETTQRLEAKLSLVCLRDGATPVMRAERDLVLDPRASVAIPATDLWGAFFDTAYSYRFGPPAHDVTIATLCDASGVQIAQSFHFPTGRGHAREDLGLAVEVRREGDGYSLAIATQRLAQSLHVADPNWRAREDWFHLPPGETRLVKLIPTQSSPPPPRGHVRAVNGRSCFSYEAPL